MNNPTFGAMVAAMIIFLLFLVGYISPPNHEIKSLLPPTEFNSTLMTKYHDELPDKLSYLVLLEIFAVIVGFSIGYGYDMLRP
jgi:hypothetical protein